MLPQLQRSSYCARQAQGPGLRDEGNDYHPRLPGILPVYDTAGDRRPAARVVGTDPILCNARGAVGASCSDTDVQHHVKWGL